HNITSFISILPPPPRSRLSPYTTLFRSRQKISTLQQALENATNSFGENDRRTKQWQTQLNNAQAALNDMERELAQNERAIDELGDRKSTRLNSSHVSISYAVFCLKKKKT